MTLIEIAEIEKAVGGLVGEERTRVEGFLADASALAAEIGKPWTETGGSNPAPVSVRLIVKRAVLRAFHEDPEKWVEERLGEWSGRKAQAGTEEVGVFYTSTEIATIRQAAGRRTAAQGSVRTPSAYGERPALVEVFVPISNAPGHRGLRIESAEEYE